jgi:hypothetical protein
VRSDSSSEICVSAFEYRGKIPLRDSVFGLSRNDEMLGW